MIHKGHFFLKFFFCTIGALFSVIDSLGRQKELPCYVNSYHKDFLNSCQYGKHIQLPLSSGNQISSVPLERRAF